MNHRFPARRSVRSGQSLHLHARSGDTVIARGDAEVACIARESRMRALLDRVLASLAAALRRLRLVHAKTGKDL